MTGFAQVKGELASQTEGNGRVAFALSLKSVNHRFLDLNFRLPSGSDSDCTRPSWMMSRNAAPPSPPMIAPTASS